MRTVEIVDLYRRRGDLAYEGEGVTQLQHAWQCGQVASRAGATPELELACWLHDLGHLLSGLGDTPTLAGLNDRHEAIGAAALLPLFGAPVSQPVALHVEAKRYLVTMVPSYTDMLSPDSLRSLVLQRGPMDHEACRRFADTAYAMDAVRLRVWDDSAKVASLQPVSVEAVLSELARLMDIVLKRLG